MTDDAALAQILARRHSCRGFLPDEVPAATIRHMFTLAQATASWCNSQAWEVRLLGGEHTAAFADALRERVLAHRGIPDIPGPERYEGAYSDRRRAAGFALYEAVGIGRDDKAGRLTQGLENFQFFGAPHVAVVSSPRALGVYGAVDCGGYVANLLNAATSLGLGSIAQAAIAMHADFVHEYLDISLDRDIVCAVSFGYADPDHPANGFRTQRDDVSTAVIGLPSA